jgi:hypothetical protein
MRINLKTIISASNQLDSEKSKSSKSGLISALSKENLPDLPESYDAEQQFAQEQQFRSGSHRVLPAWIVDQSALAVSEHLLRLSWLSIPEHIFGAVFHRERRHLVKYWLK